MGVDWYVCSVCGETFPDCGVFYTCVKGHHICENCEDKIGEYDEDDSDGGVPESACPVCLSGGDDGEKLDRAMKEIDRLNKIIQQMKGK